jgi:hypothetical protein
MPLRVATIKETHPDSGQNLLAVKGNTAGNK